ncbi:MAG: hypothetical protein LUH05_08575 [Candidatus Gastranaerophilales bacterium]|nr:hypothetical protein [Candidatus Gastranaerophilales bacterium]
MHILEKLKSLIHKKEMNNKSIYFKNSTTKHSMTPFATLKISGETEKKKKEINENLKVLLKKYINSPEKLVQYIKLKGLSVYKFRNADKLLSFIGENEGFLTPSKGFNAFVLNLVIGVIFEKTIKISFETREMFIFNSGDTEIYTIARALHKYYGFKKQLPGFDYKSQKIFKKACKESKRLSSPFSKCSIEDMYSCKEAIARDIEAINFTIELSVEYERAKKVLNTMRNEKSVNI